MVLPIDFQKLKPKYSNSLVLVWKTAAVETQLSKAPKIEPAHLLIGLCTVVDLDLLEFLDKNSPDRDAVLEEQLREIRKLRTIFQSAGVDPKILRRCLRVIAKNERFSLEESSKLHRSPAAKEAFATAEQFAQSTGTFVYPVHLLYALLLAKDFHRDEIFKELKIEKMRLLELVKDEILKRVGRSTTAKLGSKWKLN